MSAYHLATWLAKRGVEVGILTTAKSYSESVWGSMENGLRVWRVWMPRPYPMFHHGAAPQWKKPLWHLQDHVDPRNRVILGRVLDDFKPDLINLHLVQGFGHNSLLEIAKRDIRTVYFLHDLGLGCVRTTMFKSGANCAAQCAICKRSSTYKLSVLEKLRRLTFVSPSMANLDKLNRVFPVKRWPHGAFLNLHNFPPPTIPRNEASVRRFLYAGRIHPSKGVRLLLEACKAAIASKRRLILTIAGSGPDEQALREEFGQCDWVRFTGFLTQQALSNEIANSDYLCIPSILAEALGMVMVHALRLGTPVIGSNTGGIPEVVRHEENGLLVQAPTVDVWSEAICRAIDDDEMLVRLRLRASEEVNAFEQNVLGLQLEQFLVKALQSA